METNQLQDGKKVASNQEIQEERIPKSVSTVEKMGILPETANSQKKDARMESGRFRMEHRTG